MYLNLNNTDFDSFPRRESRKEYITRQCGSMWNTEISTYYRIYHSDKDPSKIAERVAEKYLGKSFDKAYSEFCARVQKHEHEEFLELFSNLRPGIYRNDYYFGKDKVIKRDPEGKTAHYRLWRKERWSKPVVFESADFKIGYQHIKTGEIFDRVPRHYYFFPELYRRIIVSGYRQTFPNRRDKTYKRLMMEKRQQLKKYSRLRKKRNQLKEYSFKHEVLDAA